jgi:hypothetical protein
MISNSVLFHRLVSAPHIEAAKIIDKFSLRDERTLWFSLLTLQKYISSRPSLQGSKACTHRRR